MAVPSSSTNFQVFPQFTGTDNNIAITPFLIPPSFTYGKDIIIRVSNVNTNKITVGGSNGVITPSNTAGSNQDFSLTWVAGITGSYPETPIVAQITVKADNVWKVSVNARQQLNTSFSVLSNLLEGFELRDNFLLPGSTSVILQRIVEAMPLSMDELLYYRYGLNSQSRYIDIQPGMRLRIEFSASQFISPVSPNSQLNGYVGNGTSYYYISRVTDQSGNLQIAFDDFLASIAPLAITPAENGVGGLIDLQAAGNARRYYRLCYPGQFAASDATGNAGISQNITLIGADRLSDLNSATSSYTSSGNPIIASAGSRPLVYNYFRGRTIIIPEILVQINNEPIYVPVGTTVRSLVDRYANISLITRAINPTTFDTSITFKRQWNKNSDYVRSYQVQFVPLSKDVIPTSPDIYSLPVVKGDSLTFSPNIS